MFPGTTLFPNKQKMKNLTQKNLKIVALFLALTTFTTSAFAIPSTGQPFDDVTANQKYADSIWFLKDNSVVQGYSDGTYRPENPLTRAEFMKIIILGTGLEVPNATSSPFSDVAMDEWYTNYIAFGNSKGYIEGYSDGTFRPNQAINKVEALKILGELVMWNFSSNPQPPNPYTDTNLNEWYGKYLSYAINHNIIDDTGSKYEPSTPITRGQMAEYIFRDYTVRELDLERYETSYGNQILNGDSYAITPQTIPALSSCTSSSYALEVLKNSVITNETQKKYLKVYQVEKTLKKDDTFNYFTNNETSATNEKITEETWFYWLDLDPTANFSHDTKIVTIDTDNCNINKYDSDLWPAVNDKELWTTDTERNETKDLVYLGDLAEPQVAPANLPEPVFGACNADPAERKKAIILYLGKDRFFKIIAVSMQAHLCTNNYQTTVITGENQDTVYQEIVTTIQAIATASKEPGGSLNNFFFYATAHGFRPNGNLLVSTEDQVNAAGEHHRIARIIGLPILTNAIGRDGFSEISSESFTVEHDTCYSGNAIPLYQAQANAVDGVVGWIGTSSDSASVSKAYTDRGGLHTISIIKCTTSYSPYASFQACMDADMNANLAGIAPNSSSISKLTPDTSDYVPFMP